ncbi:MAG: substrate binding domain-containing protein, partial [Pseudobdellovibrionaceae bacterium]
LNITEAGQNYYKHCALAVREIELGESQILASQEKPTGVLKITAPPDVGHSILPRIIEVFLSEHSEIQLELIVTNRYVDLVGEGVDLAIRAGELKDSTLVAKKFFDINSGLWASAGYLKEFGTPEHPKELSRHRMIAMESLKNESNKLTDGKTSVAIWSNPKITVDDPETIRALIAIHQGIGWLPNFLAKAEGSAKNLVQVLPGWRFTSTFSFSFVYPGQKYSSPKVRAFIQTASRFIEKSES